MDRERLRRRIARALDARADTATRDWWDRYLKGAIPFRGVKMAGVREVVHEEWPADAGVADALALFEGRYAEDKLAGMIYRRESPLVRP